MDSNSKVIGEGDWKISPLPPQLQNRHIDLGDVSPSNVLHLEMALKSGVQGIQIDFDDGECPSWRNMIQGEGKTQRPKVKLNFDLTLPN